MRRTLLIAAVACGALVAFQLVRLTRSEAARRAEIKREVTHVAADIRAQLDSLVLEVRREGERLAGVFGTDVVRTKAEVARLLEASAVSIREVQGVTVAYEPGAFDGFAPVAEGEGDTTGFGDSRLYAPYYDKAADEIFALHESYDYTLPGEKGAWYTTPRDAGARWSEPYYGEAVEQWFVDFALPFHYPASHSLAGQVRGTVTVSFNADALRDVVQDLTLGSGGYAVMASTEGLVMAHPRSSYIGTRDLAYIASKASDELERVYLAMSRGEAGVLQYVHPRRGTGIIADYAPLSVVDWSLGMVFFEENFPSDERDLNRRRIHISLLVSLAFLLLLASYFLKGDLSRREVWVLSILTTLLLAANVAYVGYLYHVTPPQLRANQTEPVVSPTDVADFRSQDATRATARTLEPRRAVPTGVFVERLTFENSYDVDVAGKIWQAYPADIAEDVTVGLRFPQMSPFAEAAYLEETARQFVDANEGQEDYVLVNFEFRVTLRLNLRYGDYPFDKRHLSIAMLPGADRDDLLLTPWVESYTSVDPVTKPGVADDVRLSGNTLVESYFNYTLEDFPTDFGTGARERYDDQPVLHFNVNLRRRLLTSFITYLIPIAVTMLLIFLLVYASHKGAERPGVIEAMAAFFFVVVYSHIDLRREIITAELMYMEYFYFLTYGMVILATANLATFSHAGRSPFDYNDNQLFKAGFFPLYFAGMLAITLTKFY